MTPQAPAQIKAATTDAPEIKNPAPNMRRIETLSEWELARETSKTWSMQQDEPHLAAGRCDLFVHSEDRSIRSIPVAPQLGRSPSITHINRPKAGRLPVPRNSNALNPFVVAFRLTALEHSFGRHPLRSGRRIHVRAICRQPRSRLLANRPSPASNTPSHSQ